MGTIEKTGVTLSRSRGSLDRATRAATCVCASDVTQNVGSPGTISLHGAVVWKGLLQPQNNQGWETQENTRN